MSRICSPGNSRLIGMVLAAGLFTVPAFGQESRASIVGRVVDASDAVIVGVKVLATNQQTGMVASGVTNESGSFRIPFLLPGKYRLTAEQTGFKIYSRNDLELRVNDSLDLTIRLEVGSLAETMDVPSVAPPLETADSSVGQVIDERRLLELPQRGGNPLELERLSPGVVNLTTLRIMKLSSPVMTGWWPRSMRRSPIRLQPKQSPTTPRNPSRRSLRRLSP